MQNSIYMVAYAGGICYNVHIITPGTSKTNNGINRTIYMMYREITKSDFRTEFARWESRKDQFTYDALGIIYDHMTDMGEEPVELDVVAICCEFTEWDSEKEYNKNYDDDLQDYLIGTTESGTVVTLNH